MIQLAIRPKRTWGGNGTVSDSRKPRGKKRLGDNLRERKRGEDYRERGEEAVKEECMGEETERTLLGIWGISLGMKGKKAE